MNVRSSLAIAVLALALSAPPLAADTTLHYQVSRGGNAAPMILRARAGEIRVDGAALGVRFKWMVYRGAENTLYAVDPQRSIYLAFDPAALDGIARRLDAMRAQLRKRLDRMPPGQRKFVESQIGDFLEEPEDADAYQGMYHLINRLQVALSSGTAKIPDISTLTGVPISMSIESSGIAQTLQRIAHGSLADDLFEIPAHYQRREPQDLLQ